MILRRTAPDCHDTLPRRGVRHEAGPRPWLPGPGFLLALWLALATPLQAALTPELWATRDSLALARAAQSGAERLLASTALERDPERLALAWRQLARMEAPEWLRREALGGLCEYFCATGRADSLARRDAELRALGAPAFLCPLLAAPAAGTSAAAGGGWWVQVGAFSSEKAARAALKGLGEAAKRRVVHESSLWKARLGPFPSEAEAKRAALDWQRRGLLKEHRILSAPPAP